MVFAVALIYIHQKYAPYRTFHGKIFGTYYHVKILTDRSDRTLGDKILRRLQDVNRQMSVFEKKFRNIQDKPKSHRQQNKFIPRNVVFVEKCSCRQPGKRRSF